MLVQPSSTTLFMYSLNSVMLPLSDNFLNSFVQKKFSSVPLLATCMDMLAYRLPHLTHQHRMTALVQTANLIRNQTSVTPASGERVPSAPGQPNLHLMYSLDWVYLILLRGIASLDFAPVLLQNLTGVKLSGFAADLEELNKALIITLIHFYKIYGEQREDNLGLI